MGLNKHDNYLYSRLTLVKKENPQTAITFISLILMRRMTEIRLVTQYNSIQILFLCIK